MHHERSTQAENPAAPESLSAQHSQAKRRPPGNVFRVIVALLWRSFAFRLALIWCVRRGFASGWIVRNTPLVACMREAMLRAGALDQARAWAELERELEAEAQP